MAEPIPHSTSESRGAEAATGLQEPVVDSTPPQQPAPGPPEPEVYRPVTGLAIICLCVAVIYAGVILIGGGFHLVRAQAYILPGWTWLLPIGGVVLALVALRRIRLSEG